MGCMSATAAPNKPQLDTTTTHRLSSWDTSAQAIGNAFCQAIRCTVQLAVSKQGG